jgi:hypothetical protein
MAESLRAKRAKVPDASASANVCVTGFGDALKVLSSHEHLAASMAAETACGGGRRMVLYPQYERRPLWPVS